MLTILSLFGRSPFAPLQSHMEKVKECVEMIPTVFAALEAKDFEKLEELAKEVSRLEHHADLMKNDIRNHLPKSIYLPIERSHLLEILTFQDSLADIAEDIAVLFTFKELTIPPGIDKELDAFLKKNLESFHGVSKIVKEFQELLESSFGGYEAEKVRVMVDEVALLEHQADLLQRTLMKKLIEAEKSISYTTYDLWKTIIAAVADISNLSEKLAYRVRMTLDLK